MPGPGAVRARRAPVPRRGVHARVTIDDLAAGSAQGAKIAKRSGLRGITIPVHPAGSRYFGPSAPASPGALSKAPAVPGTPRDG